MYVNSIFQYSHTQRYFLLPSFSDGDGREEGRGFGGRGGRGEVHTCCQHHFFSIPNMVLVPRSTTESGSLERTRIRCKLQPRHWRVFRSWRAFLGRCRRTCIRGESSGLEESCRALWREVGRGRHGLLLGRGRLDSLFSIS